jgi:hypothetical protein
VDRANDTRLALSVDGGQSFREFLAYDGVDRWIEMNPEIHAETDRTLLLLADPRGDGADVLMRVITRQGTNLSAQTVAVSSGVGSARIVDGVIDDGPRMSLVMRGDTVCAAWEDRRSRFAIYGACSTNRGQTFGPNFQISGSDDFSPRLAFGPDGALYAAYKDVEGGAVFIRRSQDNGATWDAPRQAFALGSSLRTGVIDLDVDAGGQVLLTVPIIRGSGSFSSSDLYLATSVDSGQRFALNGPLEDGQGRFPTVSSQFHPRTAIGAGPNGQRAYVIWSDDRNSQNQIWSTRLDLDSTPPDAPPNLQAQPGDTSVLLTWGPSSDQNGIVGYHVLRAPSPDGPFEQISARLVTGTSYRDVGLAAGNYAYRVFAIDGTGNPGPPSNIASATATVGVGLAGLNGTIAYQSGNNVALRAFAGDTLEGERVLGQGFAPVFSHDGNRLVTTRGGVVVSRLLDGSDVQTIYTNDSAVASLDTAADPNVLGAIHQQIYGGPNFCTAFEPRIVSLAPRQVLYDVSATIATDMAISSDRTFVAYVYKVWCNGVGTGVYDTPRLCLKNTASGAEACVDGVNVDSVDFVPQRNQVVFSASYTGQRELWRADVQPNGALSNLTQLTRGPAGQPSTAPRASTDGSWVIFVRDTDAGAGERFTLHIVRLDGDGLRSLDVVGETPAWSGGGPAPLVDARYQVNLSLVQR